MNQVQLPPLRHLLREAGAIANLSRRTGQPLACASGRCVPRRPVMVIPGFLASDGSTATLRSSLGAAGYHVRGWGQGVNLGATPDRLDRLEQDVLALADDAGEEVILIGWSLGGLYAREIAKRVPDAVDRVLTLGSPFSGSPRANRAWWLYALINRHSADNPPIEVDLAEKPPVPTIALWSREDGIVPASAARGRPHEADRRIEIGCSHIGFTFEPCAVEAILDALER